MRFIKQAALILLSLTALICGFVFAFKTSYNDVMAANYANCGVELKLVGYNGYVPKTYFDTMEQSSVETSDNYYYNAAGTKTNEYYIVSSNVKHLIGAYCEGTSTLTPFGEYITLANNGLLYVYAKTGIVTSSGDKNTVTISITHNGQTAYKQNNFIGTINSDGTYKPYYYSTSSIKVNPNKDIVFTFKNNAESSIWSRAKFKLFEPSISFNTVINNVDMISTGATVYHDNVIKLSATNDILNITESTPLINYYKNIHKIEYEIVDGSESATIVGNYIHFTGENSATVKVRAKSLKDSNLKQYIYSDIITYNYVSQKEEIVAQKNFANCATILGTGDYYIGQTVPLRANINSGYTFSHWTVNGINKTTQTINFVCNKNTVVNLFCIKQISIDDIKIFNKTYDGLTEATIESINAYGIESNHDVMVGGITAKFISSTVGMKAVQFFGTPILIGENASYYQLTETLPNTTAEILPKSVEVKINAGQKIYGSIDPQFESQISGLIGGDTLTLNYTRVLGENVGQYLISAYSTDINYEAVIERNYLTITQKTVQIKNMTVSKTYDKTNQIQIIPELIGVINGDSLSLKINATFSNSGAGINKSLSFDEFLIFGTSINNYIIDTENIPFTTGTILPKEVSVTIANCSKIYGSSDPAYDFTITGLFDSDVLGGAVARGFGEHAGVYELSYKGTNPNYKAVCPTKSYLNIIPKQINVLANSTTKIYGSDDPIISYTTQNMENDDTLSGLLSRAEGENVGSYAINIGTLANPNYTISFVSNAFDIVPKTLSVSLSFEDKIYDGNTNISSYSYVFNNLSFNDSVNLNIVANFISANAGENVEIEITNSQINNSNYTFTATGNYSADIVSKPITVTALNSNKMYGDNDVDINYICNNLALGDELFGSLSRAEGESIGSYQIYQGTVTNINNPNYDITFSNNAMFSITKRLVKIKLQPNEKVYGESDPKCNFETVEGYSLAFDDAFETVVIGKPSRISGETPGIYLYSQGTVHSNSNNYTIEFIEESGLTIKRKNITISALSATKIYGDSEPTFEYVINDDTVEEFDFPLTRQRGENVGEYKINYVSLYHEYFLIEFIPNYLTITPRQITIKADDKIKVYGDSEPLYTCSVTRGMLINGDRLEFIMSGSPSREVGENVGEYTLTIGNVQTNDNYNFEFEEGSLKILSQNITVKANDANKYYRDDDPVFTYAIVSGSLKFADEFEGSLQRDLGETLGQYEITQGNLMLSSNYTLNFLGSIFSINKGKITIKIADKQKVYGENDPIFTYEIVGAMHSGDELTGSIIRAQGENVGSYKFSSNLTNDNYDITYDFGNLIVTKRVIKITANSLTINYKDSLPQLTYTITEGNVIGGDSFVGSIYKVGGEEAGVYDINSTLNLGRNYKIEYTKGSVTILPTPIKVWCNGGEKIYGQSDPMLEYSIVEGSLFAGDILTGYITRQSGENVGQYELVNSLINRNYAITLDGGVFEIKQKIVTLFASVSEKVYDGTTTAYLRNPNVSGIVDTDVTLSYNEENCADFISSEVGNNIAVNLHDISLVGANSANYILTLPTLYSNITKSSLSNQGIEIIALENTDLEAGVDLIVNSAVNSMTVSQSKQIIKQLNLSLFQGEQEVEIQKNVQINIQLNSVKYNNLKVYVIDEGGDANLVSSSYANGVLTFSTDILGDIVIVADSNVWLDVMSLFCLAMIILGAAVIISKRKKTQ